MSEEKDDKKKEQTADEIAEIMAANMKANMEDPEFETRQELIRAKARAKIIKERKLREAKEKIESE